MASEKYTVLSGSPSIRYPNSRQAHPDTGARSTRPIPVPFAMTPPRPSTILSTPQPSPPPAPTNHPARRRPHPGDNPTPIAPAA